MLGVRRLVTIVATSAALSLALAGPAAATKVYDGEDCSYGTNHTVWICDMESDAEEALVEVENGAGKFNKFRDQDGTGYNCHASISYIDVVKHRTCESNNLLPDTCGRWGRHPG